MNDHTPVLFAQVAATLTANGYAVVPIAPGKKYPGFDNWQHFTYTPGCEAQFPQHGCGVFAEAAVDIDVNDAEVCIRVEEAVREAIGLGDAAIIPRRIGNAPRVLIPFRAAAPFKKSATAVYRLRTDGSKAKVEILAAGQQYVAFHLHPTTGRPYAWNGGGSLLEVPRDALPELTEAEARVIIQAVEAVLDEWGDRVGDPPTEATDERPSKSKILAGGRNDYLFREAGKLRYIGLSPTEVLSALQQMNRERCDPPLERGEVAQIAHSIGRYAPKETAPPPILWKLPPPISETEWETAKLTPPCIVENYLYADVAVLVAPGGTGKTTEMLYEGIHTVLARPLYGLPIVKPGPVLIISAEDSREMLIARMRAIADALDLSPQQKAEIRRDLRISDVCGEGLRLTIIAGDMVVPSPTVDTIIEEARTLQPVVVSIDPAISFGVGEARVNDAEQGLIEAARRLRRELGCCARFVHHSGKQNAREKAVDQYAGRGGSALADGARMVAVMQPVTTEEWNKATGSPLLDGETGMVLARPKLSYCPPQPDILICRKGYRFSHTVNVDRTASEELAANCAQVLRAIESECAADRRPTKHSVEAMAAAMNLTRQQVRDAVVLLLSNGKIAHVNIDPPPAHGTRTYLRPIGSPNQNGEAR